MPSPTPLNIAYPWTRNLLIANTPMSLIAVASLAFAVSRAGGFGFLAAGTDVTDLKRELQEVADLVAQEPLSGSSPDPLSMELGFISWGRRVGDSDREPEGTYTRCGVILCSRGE